MGSHGLLPHGILRIMGHQKISAESLTETVLMWRWVGIQPSSVHRMETLGQKGIQENLGILVESPMETVPLWWWVGKEPSSPHRMDPLGKKGLLERQDTSMESPTGMVPSWWLVPSIL